MKKLFTLTLVALMALLSGTAGAQSYEGTTRADGIWYVPANVGPNSVVNFAAEDLRPNSDITFNLLDENAVEVDGLAAVAGAVVLRADSQGNFNGNFRLPSNVEAGVLTLTAVGTRADSSEFSATLALTVTAEAVANPTAANDAAALALTGSDSRNRILGGVLLVGLGAGLVVFASQRRTENETA